MGKINNKIGVIGFSSYVNEKFIFKVNGTFDHNNIIQRYWDKEIAHMYDEFLFVEGSDLIVDTVAANNKYGYKLRLLAVWDNAERKFYYDYDDIGMSAEYLGLVIGLEGEPENEEEEYESCPRCFKGHLKTMYDEHPNWIMFCSNCDYRIEN
ncbi:hypothetical protein [Bacillus pseudomycoides]|uniref:hypothetical protein n=1 Tax=Bacillus pseudomycoides TaxID=64104 RepID=UPI0015CF0AC9|nr:hypothetical protein [Bacillus pseudomycoides]